MNVNATSRGRDRATAHVRRRALAALAAVLTAATAPVLAGCGGDASSAGESGGGATIRYQTFAGQPSLVELADDLGYLKPLKIRRVGDTISGPQDIQATATNQVDVGYAFNGAVVKLVQAGAPIRAVVGAYGSDAKTFSGAWVLADSKIRSARDLIGKKVGMNTLGAHSEAILQTWLARNGVPAEDAKQVQQVVIPPVNTEQALRKGQIDVAIFNGVIQDKAIARGGVRKLFSDYDLFGAFTAGSYVLRKQYIQSRPDEARKLVGGIAKAIAWLQSHDRDEVIARVTRVARKNGHPGDIPVLEYWKSPGIAKKGGVIADEEIDRWVQWLEQAGQIPKGSVKTGDVYANDLNPYAKVAS